jgi:glycosyltransferase involved in cell wall biosynthesis
MEFNKLIIQIPCFNEEATLPETLAALPRELPGVRTVEWLVVDDGSQDNTVQIAERHGVDHIIRLPYHQGLAKAFLAGLDQCLRRGADVIVNLDADNQYRAQDIPKLLEPIRRREAALVIGTRPISEIQQFSFAKKLLQRLGSLIVRVVSNTDVPDAPSGFRAFSRDAAMHINVFSAFTYTLETIIQAGHKNLKIACVPVGVNPVTRPSRLMPSMRSYVRRSALIILRIFMTYQPARFFGVPGVILLLLGLIPALRFLHSYVMRDPGEYVGHIQSLIFGALMIGSGLFLIMTGLVTDLIAVNRKLMEEIRYRLMDIEYRMHDGAKEQDEDKLTTSAKER